MKVGHAHALSLLALRCTVWSVFAVGMAVVNSSASWVRDLVAHSWKGTFSPLDTDSAKWYYFYSISSISCAAVAMPICHAVPVSVDVYSAEVRGERCVSLLRPELQTTTEDTKHAHAHLHVTFPPTSARRFQNGKNRTDTSRWTHRTGRYFLFIVIHNTVIIVHTRELWPRRALACGARPRS